MDYFGNYSIESASCHPSSLTNPRSATDIPTSDPSSVFAQFSPCDLRPGRARTQVNMSALTQCLGQSSLSLKASDINFLQNRRDRSRSPPSPSDPMCSTSSPNSKATSAATACWKRRLQRQRDMRLQTDPGHIRALRELVHDMDARHVTGGIGSLTIKTDGLDSRTHGDADEEDDDLPELSSSPGSAVSAMSETTFDASDLAVRPSALIYSLGTAYDKASKRSVDLSPISPKFGGISKVRHRRSGLMRC